LMRPLFLLTLRIEDYWLAPVAGLAVCGLAFLLGWRFLAGRPGKRSAESDDDFDATFLKGVTQERRSAPRRRGNTVEVQLVAADGKTWVGWILDRSQGGLGVLVEQPIAEGTALKVRPRTASASIPWSEVTVRSCRREGHQYDVGCQFDRLPNWNELLHFG